MSGGGTVLSFYLGSSYNSSAPSSGSILIRLFYSGPWLVNLLPASFGSCLIPETDF